MIHTGCMCGDWGVNIEGDTSSLLEITIRCIKCPTDPHPEAVELYTETHVESDEQRKWRQRLEQRHRWRRQA